MPQWTQIDHHFSLRTLIIGWLYLKYLTIRQRNRWATRPRRWQTDPQPKPRIIG